MIINDCDTFQQLLVAASRKFNYNYSNFDRIFCKEGGEIDDINFIRDNDTLYFSKSDDFTVPCNAANVASSKKKPRTDWVTLNVGGRCFTTSKSTLTAKEPDSMLARMFAEDDLGYLFTPSNVDAKGAFLIDRSPTYFEPILNYLRNGQLIYDKFVNPEGILEEARFFGIESIVPALETIIDKDKLNRDTVPLSKRDVINALIMTPYSTELRFQGVNLSGADLSKLDLRFINFKVRLFCNF